MKNLARMLVFLLTCSSVVYADAPEVLTARVTVSAVNTLVADQGRSTRLKLRIRNDGSDVLNFLGVTSEVAEGSKLRGRIGHSHKNGLESLAIPPEETLELDTSHLWLSLEKLSRPLTAGETFQATLLFSSGKLPVVVHVHH